MPGPKTRFDTGVPPFSVRALVGETGGEEVGCSVEEDFCPPALFLRLRRSLSRSGKSFVPEVLAAVLARTRAPEFRWTVRAFLVAACTVMSRQKTTPTNERLRGFSQRGAPALFECGSKKRQAISKLSPGGVCVTYR